jgi:Icc-related predicted phosphoesterase
LLVGEAPPTRGTIADRAMLTLVAMADTHLYHEDLEVPDGDVLIHAGDMARGGRLEELEASRDFLAVLPHSHKIVVAGNHDRAFESTPAVARKMFADFIYLQDDSTTIDGVRFYGSPWSPWFYDWAFNLERGAPLAEKWALIPDDTDVLITHGPPHGIGDCTYDDRREGCADLLARVRQVRPKLHIFGHIHEERGVWRVGPTTFANVTTNECTEPPMVLTYPPTTI